jgi:hypothetical protein
MSNGKLEEFKAYRKALEPLDIDEIIGILTRSIVRMRKVTQG